MPGVVALDVPWDRSFPDALRRVWEAGDAAAVLDPRLPEPAARAALGTLGPTAVLDATGGRTPVAGGRPAETGDALVVATSGSSGLPRGVVLTHAAVAASALATTGRLGVDRSRHVWLACLPLAHIGGLSVVTRALVTGTALTVLDRFEAQRVEELGRRGSVTHVSLVATALRRVDPTVFERILLGGAAPPGRVPDNVVTTYGLTESGSGVVYDGRPIDGTEVSIGDGSPGGGAEGEILLRGPTLLRCYRDGEDPRIPGPGGSGGWVPTGDGGALGDDGRLRVHGRLAEVVVTGGEKVWPTAVERVLEGQPGVSEVAVWRRADPEWGERVVAWVVARDPAEPPRLEQLRDAVGAVLPPWCAPKELVLVPALPRTPSGKVRRRDLV